MREVQNENMKRRKHIDILKKKYDGEINEVVDRTNDVIAETKKSHHKEELLIVDLNYLKDLESAVKIKFNSLTDSTHAQRAATLKATNLVS